MRYEVTSARVRVEASLCYEVFIPQTPPFGAQQLVGSTMKISLLYNVAIHFTLT